MFELAMRPPAGRNSNGQFRRIMWEASMDLEIFNTRGTDEEGHGKGKKKIRGPGTPAFRKLAEDKESARKTCNRRKGRGDAKGGRGIR